LDKILFYDNKLDHLFVEKTNKEFVINYFDIEVQKILKYLGYSFKCNPKLIMYPFSIGNERCVFDYICNLNNSLSLTKKFAKEPCIAIIFDCYR
jgi:hypothetical protein